MKRERGRKGREREKKRERERDREREKGKITLPQLSEKLFVDSTSIRYQVKFLR